MSEEKTATGTGSEEAPPREEKLDVKKLVAVIPPPSMLRAKKQTTVREKRIRLRYSEDIPQDQAKICSKLAKELGIEDVLEITVAGKKRFRFKAVIDDSVPYDYVIVNAELMRRYGVADNSMCTIRRGQK